MLLLLGLDTSLEDELGDEPEDGGEMGAAAWTAKFSTPFDKGLSCLFANAAALLLVLTVLLSFLVGAGVGS